MFLRPMLLQGFEEPFDDNEFIFEPKLDGFRLIFSHINKTSHLYSRFHHNVTRLFPELYHLDMDEDIVLDGVVAKINHFTGRVDYDCIKPRLQMRNFSEIQQHSIHNPVNYIVFDVLYKGRDLRGLPLMKRREILRKLEFGNRNIGSIAFIENEGNRLFEEIKLREMDGMVAKRKNSLYIANRSDEWLKIINWQYEDFYITGYQTDKFGILVSLPDHNEGLRQVGIISSGLTVIDKLTFLTVCKQLVIKEVGKTVVLQPLIKARIKFRKNTKEGILRSPIFTSFIV
jgi:DNA ligase-1